MSYTPNQEKLAVSPTGELTLTDNLSVSGSITASGDITAFSDLILKENVTPIENALEKVDLLTGVTYFKDGKQSVGLIAQNVQQVIPEAVQKNGEYFSVAYGNLVGVLIQAIKELKLELEELKKEK